MGYLYLFYCTHSMRSMVYETVGRPSVHPSVCPIDRSNAAAACGGFAAELPAAAVRRCRSTAGAGAQQQRRRSTTLSSKCGQCHADRRRRRRNTDLFRIVFCCIGLVAYIVVLQHPYPSEEQKRNLSTVTGLNLSQVNNW